MSKAIQSETDTALAILGRIDLETDRLLGLLTLRGANASRWDIRISRLMRAATAIRKELGRDTKREQPADRLQKG